MVEVRLIPCWLMNVLHWYTGLHDVTGVDCKLLCFMTQVGNGRCVSVKDV